MKKLLILLAGLAIIAMVAVPAIIMQPADRINQPTQSCSPVVAENATSALSQVVIPAQAPSGTEMLLDCADADMALTILDGYMLQEVTSDAYHKGSKYVFANHQTGVTFSIHGTLDDAQSQSKIMNTVRGNQNNAVVFDHTQVGDFSYLIHHATDCNWIWSFCMLTDTGFSYRFWFEFPAQQGQDAIPQDALTMLSSIRLVEKTPLAVQGVTYELDVETAMITLTLPSEYEMRPLEWYEFAPLPEKYEFLNTATGSTFLVDSYSLDAENQALLMRKMRDARGMVILDNMTFGSYQGTARYQTDYNYDHYFLILGDNGYAYQFQMRLPEDQGQNSPPEEALMILETLQITGK